MSPQIVTSRDQLPNQPSRIESIIGIEIIPKIVREIRENLSIQGDIKVSLCFVLLGKCPPPFMSFRDVISESTHRRMGSSM